MRQENECLAEDWKLIPFNSNIEMLSGFPFDSSQFNESEGKPLIRIRNINSGKTKTYFKGEYSEEYVINKGDILVGMDGDFHIKKWQGAESLLNQRILKLYESRMSEINLDFFYYLSQPFLLKVHKRTAGTTVKHLSTKDFKNASYKVPTYTEQQKIAEILSTVDAKIEIIDQQITETQELKKGVMQRLLTKGIGHTEFKDSALGEIPESWEVLELGGLLKSIKGGGTPSKEISEYWAPEIPWVTVKDLKKTILNDSIDYISKIGLENSAANLIPAWTLIISTRMAVGKGVFVTKDVSINQDLKALFPKDNLNKFFLFHWFFCNSENILSLASGSTVKGIRLEVLKGLKLALPTIIEQQKIADILSSVDEKLAVLSEKKTTYQELKQGLMQQLLTGKVRVRI